MSDRKHYEYVPRAASAAFRYAGRQVPRLAALYGHRRGWRSREEQAFAQKRRMPRPDGLPSDHVRAIGARFTGPGATSTDLHVGGRISMSTGSDARVTRSYESVHFTVNNNAGIYNATAFSLRFGYDAVNDTADARIMAGGPALGTDISCTFPELAQEFQHMSRVFRYCKVDRMEMCHVQMPQQTIVNGSNVTDGSAGTVTQIPWAGQPGMFDYTTGDPTNAITYRDYARYKSKHVFDACHQDPRMIPLCVKPVSVVSIPEIADDSTLDQVEYVSTGSVDIDRFRSGEENLNSYGWAYYWNHPQQQTSTQFQMEMFFRIELSWYGVRVPSALAEDVLNKPVKDGRLAQLLASGVKVHKTDPNSTDDGYALSDLIAKTSKELSDEEKKKRDQLTALAPDISQEKPKLPLPKDDYIVVNQQKPPCPPKVMSRPPSPARR